MQYDNNVLTASIEFECFGLFVCCPHSNQLHVTAWYTYNVLFCMTVAIVNQVLFIIVDFYKVAEERTGLHVHRDVIIAISITKLLRRNEFTLRLFFYTVYASVLKQSTHF